MHYPMQGFQPTFLLEVKMYEYSVVSILAELRKDAGLSQQVTASYFGLKNRDSVSAWEIGKSRPHTRHRERFILYLLDKIGLRRDIGEFIKLWESVMVREWGWRILSENELLFHFPSCIKEVKQSIGQRTIIIIWEGEGELT